MGTISTIASAMNTALEIRRSFDGSLFNYATQQWAKPTPESLAASDKAVMDFLNATLDLIPFPLQTNILNSTYFDITRDAADSAIIKIGNIIKEYVNATTVNK